MSDNVLFSLSDSHFAIVEGPKKMSELSKDPHGMTQHAKDHDAPEEREKAAPSGGKQKEADGQKIRESMQQTNDNDDDDDDDDDDGERLAEDSSTEIIRKAIFEDEFTHPLLTENVYPTYLSSPRRKERSKTCPFAALRSLAHMIDSSGIDVETHPWFNSCVDSAERDHLIRLREVNRKRLGCIAFDTSVLCQEFVSFSPKCYSLLLDNAGEKCRFKGVNAVDLSHKDYKEHYDSDAPTHKIPQFNFVSKRHHLFKKEFLKQGFTKLDYKRVWLNKTESFPHGSYEASIVKDVSNLIDDLLDQIC